MPYSIYRYANVEVTEGQTFCKEALVPVKDNLPHFAGFPASLGGSDDRVDW